MQQNLIKALITLYIMMIVLTYGRVYNEVKKETNNADLIVSFITASLFSGTWPLYWSTVIWEEKPTK